MSSDETARLKSIVETAVDGIITIDHRGVIETFNQAAERLFGYSAGEAVGQNVSMLMPVSYGRQHDGYLAHYLATGEKQIIGVGREVPGRRKDGTTFPMRLSVGEFQEDDRRLFTGIVHDLTEHKQAEQRMLQTERLAAIGEVMATLTHESRNALQLTSANLDMLALVLEDHPESLEYIARIHGAQNRLQSLFEEVRMFAAPIILETERCNLGQLADVTTAQLKVTRSGKPIRVIQRTDDVDLNCEVDRFRVERVFRNLLENSVAACCDTPTIEMNWSDAAIANAPALQLTYQDNGPGLSEEQRQHIFEPFYTTKSRGTGLGMPITKRIVESHGGWIDVSKNGHSGAEFIITLPRHPQNN